MSLTLLHFAIAVSKAIVDLHKGRISVASEGEGRGCTFTLDIPAREAVRESVLSKKPSSSDCASKSAIVQFVSRSRMSFSRSSLSDIPLLHPHPHPGTVVAGLGRSLASVHSMLSHDDDSVYWDQTSPELADEGKISSQAASLNMASTTLPLEGVYRPEGARLFRAMSRLQDMDELRVLVVDDSATNRKMLCRLLKGKYKTMEAGDGEEAVAMVMERWDTPEAFQVIVMDHNMPKKDGAAATKLLREKGYKGVIIGVTGNTLVADVSLFLSHGADKVLPKPVNLELLERTIAGDLYYRTVYPTIVLL